MGETLNGASGLDIDAEKSIVEEKLDELRKDGVSEKETRVAMKELGIKRFVNLNYIFTTKRRELLMETIQFY